MSPRRIALLLALLPLAVVCLPAQQTPDAAPTPATAKTPTASAGSNQAVATIHVTSRLVVLDVVVTDGNGNPVKGLKQSDFALTEDGVAQSLYSFSEHDATDAPPAPATAVAPLPLNTFAVQPPLPEAGPKTVIVLDNIHYPNDPYTRADILAFLKTLAPGNPIAIIRMDWQGLHLVQDFTSDPQELQEAVASPRMLPPLPPINVNPWTVPPCALPYQGVIDPYGRLARYLDGIPGRINLAWVTDEGKPDRKVVLSIQADFPRLANLVRNLNGPTDVTQISRVVPYLIKAGGYIGGLLAPISNYAPMPMPQVYQAPVADPPLGCPLFPTAQGGLLANKEMADEATALGGHAFFDGTTKALAQIVALGSDYYSLSYVPTNPNWNGAYRKIALNVSGIPETGQSSFGWSAYGQPKVVYRRGYYARSKPAPSSESAAFGPNTLSPIATPSVGNRLVSSALPGVTPRAASTMETAMGFGTLTPNQIDFTIAVTPSAQIDKPRPGAALPKGNFISDLFRNDPRRNYRVHYQIAPNDLKFTRVGNGSYRDELQFVAIVYRDDGLLANSVSITAHIQVSAANLEKIMAAGVTFDQTIAMPVVSNPLPENFFLRVGVGEASTGHVGAIELPAEWIELPTATAVAVASRELP